MKKQCLSVFIAMIFTEGVVIRSALAADAFSFFETEGSVVIPYNLSQRESVRFETNNPYVMMDMSWLPNEILELNAVSWLSTDQTLVVDEAMVVVHLLQDDRLDFLVGRQYLPLGSYDTEMISDPLTEVLGSARRDHVFMTEARFRTFLFAVSLSRSDSGTHRNTYTIRLGFDNDQVWGGVDYTDDITESGEIVSSNSIYKVPGLAVYGAMELGRLQLMVEHISVLGTIESDTLDSGLQPSATHLEANIDLDNERVFAVSWNDTQAAEALGLTKSYFGVTYRQPLLRDFFGAIELARFINSNKKQEDTINIQVRYEF